MAGTGKIAPVKPVLAERTETVPTLLCNLVGASVVGQVGCGRNGAKAFVCLQLHLPGM
jgi:hypothetical protein